MNLQNHARKFNTIMPKVNHAWAAEILGMQINPNEGPDLIDDKKIVELKFNLVPNKKRYVKWTAFEHQLEYNQRDFRFWGLGIYQLYKPVSEITTFRVEELENLVESRELFLVDLEWARRFKPSPSKGQTEISEWDNTFIYLKYNQLPEIIHTQEVIKGLIHLTKDVPIEKFSNLG